MMVQQPRFRSQRSRAGTIGRYFSAHLCGRICPHERPPHTCSRPRRRDYRASVSRHEPGANDERDCDQVTGSGANFDRAELRAARHVHVTTMS